METPPAVSEAIPFEQAMAELQQVLRKLEDGETGLEEALASYEKGVGLLKHCYGLLREAEQRILQLNGTDEEGKPVTHPFIHLAMADGAADSPPRRKRGTRTDIPF